MGNLMTNLKRFLSNKNTVTILGVILGVINIIKRREKTDA